jgi:hypothetical protein
VPRQFRAVESRNRETLGAGCAPGSDPHSEWNRGSLQVTGTAFLVLFCIVGMAQLGLPFSYDFRFRSLAESALMIRPAMLLAN